MNNISWYVISLLQENTISSEKIRNWSSFGNFEVVEKIRKLRNLADKLIFPTVYIFSLRLRVLGLISLRTLKCPLHCVVSLWTLRVKFTSEWNSVLFRELSLGLWSPTSVLYCLTRAGSAAQSLWGLPVFSPEPAHHLLLTWSKMQNLF